jgi:serine/threonine-protein kinase PpkA
MQIPGYSIIHEINTGGMSTVFLATQMSVGRKVALKIMNPLLDNDPEFHQRFQREATIIGQLSHPNIIPIYDIGRHQGLNYISMEFMPNGSLVDKIAQSLSVEQSIRITSQIAAALEHAHSKGYVHRDIKPDNILFREDHSAVLTDFGIARTIKSDNRMTQVGSVIGTPYYMSPEQARGEPTDARSDLYSLGVVFYEMLTGQKLFDSDSAVSLGIKHIHEQPSKLPWNIAFLQPVIDKLLAKKSEQRYQTAHELIKALKTIVDNRQISNPQHQPEKIRRFIKNSQQLVNRGYGLIANLTKKPSAAHTDFNQNTQLATQIYQPVSLPAIKKFTKINKRFFIYVILLVGFVILAIALNRPQETRSISENWLTLSDESTQNISVPLNIITEPENAQIRFPDLKKTYQEDMLLPQGAYQVEISSPGYITKTQWIRMNQYTEAFEIQLQKQQNDGNLFVLPDMILIKKGKFLMGDEQTARKTTISENFYISRYEITFNEYDFFATETNRSLPDDNGWGRGDRPVINISWDDAIAYTNWLSKTTGKVYRLPTAAEWEYAARGNTTSHYWWGNNPDDAYQRANCTDCKPWWRFFYGDKTEIVGSFPPNDFGLHNTAGNVAEWTADCADNANASAFFSSCNKRVIRGGSYTSKVENITSFAQRKLSANKSRPNLGLRVLREMSSRFDNPQKDGVRKGNIFQDIKNSLFNSRQNINAE